MYTSPIIANNILHRFENGITPMKLQRLLYIVYKEYMDKTGLKLFNEPFETWKYGSVVRCVYDEFESFGTRDITDYSRNAVGKSFIVSEEMDLNLKVVLDDVIAKYGDMTGIELSKLICNNKNGAWKKACVLKNYIIRDDDIRNEQSYIQQ